MAGSSVHGARSMSEVEDGSASDLESEAGGITQHIGAFAVDMAAAGRGKAAGGAAKTASNNNMAECVALSLLPHSIYSPRPGRALARPSLFDPHDCNEKI